jgi:ABC-type lipoprotein release transport system permease subunit
MNLNLKMAWLNIWRRKVRSVLVILMIGVSMSVMLSIQGLYDGMTKHLIQSTIRSESGEVTLYAPSYRLQQKLKYHITNTKEIVDSLEKMPEVKAVSERIRVMGLVSTAHKSTMAKMIGVDTNQENVFGNFQDFVVEGKFEFGEDQNGAVIGKKLAKTLGVTLGSRVIFSAQDIHGELSSVSLRIRGIVQTTNLAIDDMALFVDLKKSELLTGLTHGERTEISLRIHDGVNLTQLKKKLKAQWPGLEIYTWKELYPALVQMQQMMTIFNGITFGIVMVMVFIGILGVMFVSILERIREFGILIAIGEPYRYLRMQVIFEALLLGSGGYVIGSIAGAAALHYLQVYGLDLSAFSAGLEEFGMNSILYATMEFYYFTFTLGAIILAALLSVILPLRKIKRLHPIDVIQGD